MSSASVRAEVTQALGALNDAELQQVVEYVSFLRFRHLVVPPPVTDDRNLAALYAESAEEDRLLAEAGMEEFLGQLDAEDAH